MRYMSSNEIRKTWLDFFKDHQHVIIPSSPLVPKNDRTLLWINAGVAPLKKYFDGSVTPPAKRLTNIQKCIRTNDIENVGLTARHHTFFEMMGNFSIGDYFKVEAIKLASILLFSDKYFGFPKNLIYITYYPADTICYEQWLKEGLSSDHLIPLESNFWEIGPGPSGPDTEVFFDRGEAYDARGSELIANDLENDRFIEIGNIVFSQFNANPKVDRSLYLELPHKNIDTGFGLERFACVLQGTKTNFETDLFYPIIEEVERLTKIKYQGQMAFKVIADHIKALSMAIADGALISNVGRGYVLRRILRRALNYGHQLNLNEPFLYKLVDVTCEIMKTFYPDIQTKVEIVKEIIKNEEKQFLKTLLEGENIFNSYIENHDFIDGDFAFKLYDTYGFPIELTKEMAISKNLKIDLDGYQKHLIKQKEDSRNNKKQLGMESQNAEYLNFWEKSKFLGYDTYETSSKVIKIFPAGIVLDVTPFYATSGGQVCDKGRINNIPIQEVTKLPNGQFLHHTKHKFLLHEAVKASIDCDRRFLIQQNHSATHLLQASLRKILGSHVTQQGSYVSDKGLRFDFNNFSNVDETKILEVEALVNSFIKQKNDVVVSYMNYDDAIKKGAMAIFSEKYSETVRVVDMGNSVELCGGTHVNCVCEIGSFAIGSISSIGSGIFRIEAVSGQTKSKILRFLRPLKKEIKNILNLILQLDPSYRFKYPKVVGSYQDILNLRTSLEELRRVKQIKDRDLKLKIRDNFLATLNNLTFPANQDFYIYESKDISLENLREGINLLWTKTKAKNLVCFNVSEKDISFLVRSETQQASAIISEINLKFASKGGGSKTLAQGGTPNIALAADILKYFKELLK